MHFYQIELDNITFNVMNVRKFIDSICLGFSEKPKKQCRYSDNGCIFVEKIIIYKPVYLILI